MSIGKEIVAEERMGMKPVSRGFSLQPPANVGDAERILSLVGGLTLTVWALKRFPFRGMATLGVAAGLLYRGFTGRCQAYSALGLDTRHDEKTTAVPAPAETGMPSLQSSGQP